MQLIPVIDLLDGHAVRAERGQRERYRPIRSSLAATSEPVAIARALVAACEAQAPSTPPASPTLYVADLGAILQRGAAESDALGGAHPATVAALVAALPGVAIWIDAGFDGYAAMQAYFAAIARALADMPSGASATGITPRAASGAAALRTRVVPVFGTESLRDPCALRDAERDGYAPILSLDRRAGRPMTAADAPALPEDTAWWPPRVISMTLDQVGSYAGPDLATLARLRERAPRQTQWIGAGGIRHRDDLRLAQASGAHAWLVASALHDRRLDAPATPAEPAESVSA